MREFSREGGVPVFNMLGGWSPSRAIGPPDPQGDPVQLGLLPQGTAPLETPTLPPEIPLLELEANKLTQEFSPPRQGERIDIETGLVYLNGIEPFPLTQEALHAIMAAVATAYEAELEHRVRAIRTRFNVPTPERPTEEAMRQASDQIALVLGLPRETAERLPEGSGLKTTTNVQQVPNAIQEGNAVPDMPRPEERSPASAPKPRHRLPRPTPSGTP